MSEYRNLSLSEKVKYLCRHKGEMSIELWNDRAQCVLAPLEADNARLKLALEARGEQLRLANVSALQEEAEANTLRAKLAEYELALGNDK